MNPNSKPTFVGCVTLAIGSGLVAAPRFLTRPLGLTGQDTAVRLIGASALVLAPGLLRGDAPLAVDRSAGRARGDRRLPRRRGDQVVVARRREGRRDRTRGADRERRLDRPAAAPAGA